MAVMRAQRKALLQSMLDVLAWQPHVTILSRDWGVEGRINHWNSPLHHGRGVAGGPTVMVMPAPGKSNICNYLVLAA